MTAKSCRFVISTCIVLLLGLSLMWCINGGEVVSSANNVDNDDSTHGVDIQTHRWLRMQAVQAVDGEGDPAEEKAFEFLGVAALKNVANSQTWKNIGTSVKRSFTSDKQKQTNNLFDDFKLGELNPKYFESAAYQQWDKSVAKRFKETETRLEAMFNTMRSSYGDGRLAKFLAEEQSVSNIAKQFGVIQSKTWLKEQKTTGEIYDLLNLNADESLLKNPLLHTFLDYAKLRKEDPYSLLATQFTKQNGEDGFIKIFVGAKADDSTQAIASKLEKVQLWKWAKSGAKDDGVFKLLGLQTVKRDELLRNPAMKTWVSFADMFGRHESLLFKLSKHYNEDELASIIFAAKVDPLSKDLATRLQLEQLKKWLSNRKPVDVVFKLLRLDVGKSNKILKNPTLGLWIDYATSFGKDPYDLLVPKLKNNLGEGGLAKMLLAGKANESTKRVAVKLEQVQLANWLSEGKTADDAFKLVRLNEVDLDGIAYSPALNTWISYVNMLDNQHPDSTMLHRRIVNLLNVEPQLSIHGITEKALLQTWKAREKTPDEAAKILGLKIANADEIMKNPAGLGTWISYVSMLKRNPYELLVKKYARSYGEGGLTAMLSAAKTDPNKQDIAIRLERTQLENWKTDGKTADEVFQLLQLDDKSNDILKNPVLTTWVSYAQLNKGDPYGWLAPKLMNSHDEANLAKMIVSAMAQNRHNDAANSLRILQLSNWRTNGKTAEDAFKLLGLNKAKGYNLLKDPALATWVLYVEKVRGEDPYQLLFLKLKTFFSEEELLKMIMPAKRSYSGRYSAQLLNAQYKYWLEEGKSADDIFDLLKLNKDGDNFFDNPMLHYWGSFVRKMDREKANMSMLAVMKKHYDDETLQKMLTRALESSTVMRPAKSMALRLKKEMDLR
ncbi:hypothetical protein L915_19227 [Phytophthora nicotianae]|uniref:RxLR effector protein n=2 Tax=Phytophthora nicotianae TaxID=4792 RepID=W2I1R1_PHYNI|nr:hypothetical protein L915_19227 [Phytophthora nicotianae]ETL27313.1 hypothetical protein L916_19121 [Phytophthora nicotianae]